MNTIKVTFETMPSVVEQIFYDLQAIKEKLAAPAPEKPTADLCDIKGAKEETGLSLSTIYQYSAAGKIPRIKTPKRVLYSRKALREWVLSGMPDVSRIEAANELAKSVKR